MDFVLIVIAINIASLIHNLASVGVARAAGLRIGEFGIGVGPRLIRWYAGGTQVSICPIPLGGFIKVKRGDGEGEPDHFNPTINLPIVWRIAFLLAVPAALVAIGYIGLAFSSSRLAGIAGIAFLWTGIVSFLPVPFTNGLYFLISLRPRWRQTHEDELLPMWFILLSMLGLVFGTIVLLVLFASHVDAVLAVVRGALNVPPN